MKKTLFITLIGFNAYTDYEDFKTYTSNKITDIIVFVEIHLNVIVLREALWMVKHKVS